MPFNQSNKSAFELQEKYTKMEIAFQRTKEELVKTRENSNKYFTELEYKTRENNLLKTDNEKLKKQIKETFQKQNSKDKDTEINYDDYYRKLMNIVKLEGEDPVWRKYANLAMPSFQTMTEDQLKLQCESIWRSKL
jgi:regulator of replication initiation timing